MKPPPFALVRPRSVPEALEALASDPEAKLIAGGQSLVPLLNLRMTAPSLLVDLNGIDGLADVILVDNELRIGAMTRHKDLLVHPLIATAAPLIAAAMPHVGHVQTRNRGTIGGSLAHADPAAELPLAIAALDGVLVAISRRGSRHIRAGDFFADALTTALEADEMLVEVRLPAAVPGTRVAFREFSRRHGDFAIAAAAVQAASAGDAMVVKAALGGVAPVPHVCRELAAGFAEGTPDPDRLAQLIAHEISLLDPQTDLQASGAYRRHLAHLALTEALQKVLA